MITLKTVNNTEKHINKQHILCITVKHQRIYKSELVV